jgi:hypothetical protein
VEALSLVRLSGPRYADLRILCFGMRRSLTCLNFVKCCSSDRAGARAERLPDLLSHAPLESRE